METSPEAIASTRPAQEATRLAWPDVAKGACILLVVLHHVIVKHYLFIVPPSMEPVADVWHALTYALKPVRMPLFFVVSGFFAAGVVARPWRASWRRVASGYYLYVVWLAVFAGLYSLDREIPANRVQGLVDLAGELVWAASSMWFLYALAVYVVVAKLVRGLPPALVVGAAAGLSFSASGLGIEENNRFAVLVHLVYFLAGAFYPSLVRRIAGLAWTPATIAGVAALYATASVTLASGLPWSAIAFVVSLVGVPLGIVLAVRVSGTRVGRGLAWVGQRTLRVYVLHLVVLVAVVQVPIGLVEQGVLGVVVALVHPLVVSALVVVACFGLHHLLVRLGAGWLFALPAPLDQRLAAASTGPVGSTGARVVPTGQPGAKVPSEPRSGITG